MKITSELFPEPAGTPIRVPAAPFEPPDVVTPTGERRASRFSEALAQVERHRTAVRTTLALALLARLVFEYRLVTLLLERANLQAQLPVIGTALLSYLIVLWFLAVRTRDRFGFGMALGIGVLEATYGIVLIAMQRPFTLDATWPLMIVAASHLLLAGAALHAATAFPPHDGKRPWLVGFATAVVFVAIPWVAPTLIDLATRHR